MLFTKSFFSPLYCAVLMTFLSLSSCYVDESSEANLNTSPPDILSSKTYPLADEDLWIYFEEFEQQAALRDIDIDLTKLKITGVIENISEDGVAGTCEYGQHIHHVTVDKEFWSKSSYLRREMVVFHELGHCVLAKDHNEDSNRENVCLSIMNSGTGDCRVDYNSQNRDYYIDELFSNLE